MVGPDDGRFINPASGFRNCCNASAGASNGLVCTLPRGHTGNHAAHLNAETMVSRWSQDDNAGALPGTVACGHCGMRRERCTNSNCANLQRRCAECCSCNSVPFRDQERNLFLGEPSARFPRYVGVEVECGKLVNAKTRSWTNVATVANKYRLRVGTDGSIQQFKRSTEISTTPARGDILDAQLKELGEALIKDDIKANSSCGFHVHVDVRDYTVDHLLTFAYLADRLEKPLYRLVARSRRTGYSKVWGNKIKGSGALDLRAPVEERLRRLDIMLYGSVASAQQYKSSRNKHESRYHGINFNSISVHGTIEFRMHHGTVNPTKMRMWTALCSAIIEYAFKHTEEEVRALKGTNTEILETIIGDPEVIAWTRARRALFANMERQAHGLTPLAKPVKATGAGKTSRRRIPVADPGDLEMSEGSTGT